MDYHLLFLGTSLGLNVILYFFFLFSNLVIEKMQMLKKEEINQCFIVYLIQETFAHFEASFMYGLILKQLS